MEKGLLLKKSVFIKESKEDIRNYYDIAPKVTPSNVVNRLWSIWQSIPWKEETNAQ